MRTLTGPPGGNERTAAMTVLGYIFLAILAVTGVAALVLLVVFRSDIRRYLTIRKM